MTEKNKRWNSLWIVGFGNPQRRDDGIGRYVSDQLLYLVGDSPGILIQHQHQLDPVLMEDLKDARGVVFVDATVARLINGWTWMRLQPQMEDRLYRIHHLSAPMLLGLMIFCYGRCPDAWMAAVQGENFNFGDGLSHRAKDRADTVVRRIAAFARSWNRMSLMRPPIPTWTMVQQSTCRRDG